jgi:hypothetical protein
MLRSNLIIILLFTVAGLIACTIGVAGPEATSTGRAMLWKTRDIAGYPDNYLEWNTESAYSFLYVRDFRDSLAWMGFNEKGFCVVNSYVEREIEDRPIFNNGTLIFHLLGNCATIEDMDVLMDSLNISDQILSGNFGVIDSTGAAAMYEISWTHVAKYDAAESAEGYIIRTNFSEISGGTDGIERYNRSNAIIGGLVEAERLNPGSLFEEHFRDFSDESSEPVPVPYYDRWFYNRPWGYIKTADSICRGIAASGTVFEGVLPGEPAYTTAMYSLLGNPASTVFLPYFPIGEPPHQATPLTGMQLTSRANQIKSLLFNFPLNSYYIDSFNLRQPGETRLFDILPYFDAAMYDQSTAFLVEWRQGNANLDEALVHSEYWANEAMQLLEDIDQYISSELQANFEANVTEGGYPLSVTFSDMTPHYPVNLSWDFDNDGVIDITDMETPNWVYNTPGTYSVRLFVSSASGEDELIREEYIQVNETEAGTNDLLPLPLLYGSFPNPANLADRHTGVGISFYLPESISNIQIDIFDPKGKRVISKVFLDTLSAGDNLWHWDCRSGAGDSVSSGVYLYRLKLPGYKNISGKLTVIR